MYIAIEGIDGSGKTTARKAIVDWLEENVNKPICSTRLPGGCVFSEKLREAVLGSTVPLNPVAEVCGMMGAHIQTGMEVITPAIHRDEVVLSDRCFLSGFAYQRNAYTAKAFDVLMKSVTMPDLIILLDLEPKVASERMKDRADQLDYMESKGLDFFEKVREKYLRGANNYSDITTVISSGGTIPETYALVYEALTKRFSKELIMYKQSPDWTLDKTLDEIISTSSEFTHISVNFVAFDDHVFKVTDAGLEFSHRSSHHMGDTMSIEAYLEFSK